MAKNAGSKYALHCTRCKSILAYNSEVSKIASTQFVKGVVGYILLNDCKEDTKSPIRVDLTTKRPANNENEFDIGSIFCHLKCKHCDEFIGRYYTLVPEDLKPLKNKAVLLSKYVASMPCEESTGLRENLMEMLKHEEEEYKKQLGIYKKLVEMYEEINALESEKERENVEDIIKSIESLMKMSRCILTKQNK